MKEGPQGKRDSARAFTLIELLVVIAVIALIATLLLPALSKAKVTARAAACRSNLRQVHLTLAMYVSEFGAYPPAYGSFGLVQTIDGYEFHPLAWYLALAAHSDMPPSIYLCPQPATHKTLNWAIPQAGNGPVTFTNWTTFAPMNYGYNASGTAPFGTGSTLGLGEDLNRGCITREQAIQSPAEMIAFGDAQRDLVLSPLGTDTKPAARHNSKANLTFCDGHTEAKTPAQWTANTETARSRWNNDSQAHF